MEKLHKLCTWAQTHLNTCSEHHDNDILAKQLVDMIAASKPSDLFVHYKHQLTNINTKRMILFGKERPKILKYDNLNFDLPDADPA